MSDPNENNRSSQQAAEQERDPSASHEGNPPAPQQAEVAMAAAQLGSNSRFKTFEFPRALSRAAGRLAHYNQYNDKMVKIPHPGDSPETFLAWKDEWFRLYTQSTMALAWIALIDLEELQYRPDEATFCASYPDGVLPPRPPQMKALLSMAAAILRRPNGVQEHEASRWNLRTADKLTAQFIDDPKNVDLLLQEVRQRITAGPAPVTITQDDLKRMAGAVQEATDAAKRKESCRVLAHYVVSHLCLEHRWAAPPSNYTYAQLQRAKKLAGSGQGSEVDDTRAALLVVKACNNVETHEEVKVLKAKVTRLKDLLRAAGVSDPEESEDDARVVSDEADAAEEEEQKEEKEQKEEEEEQQEDEKDEDEQEEEEQDAPYRPSGVLERPATKRQSPRIRGGAAGGKRAASRKGRGRGSSSPHPSKKRTAA